MDVYVVNLNDYTDENIEILFRETNSIWKNYGVQFHINSINWVNNDSLDFVISPDRKALKFGESVVGERLYREKDKIIDLIIVENLYSELEILNLWFKWPFPIFGGRGVSVNDTNFIPFSPFSKNASWVLVHEMGHLLGQYDMAYYMREYNLMTNDGCIKYDYFPTILNQEQVNSVTSTIKNKNFKQL